MANPMDPVLSHHTSQERQPAAVPELLNSRPHQSPRKNHAEDHTEQIEATRREDHSWRTGRLQSRKEHHRVDLQPTNFLWEISSAPARPLPSLHRLQEGLRQGLSCSFVGNHEEVQHQHQSYPSHKKTSMTRPKCSPLQQQHRRLVPNKLESDRDVYSHPFSSIYFSKGSWQMP